MTKVLLGMSGGLDSSVAALLLKQQGYDVIGMTIKTYNYDQIAGSNPANDTSCCSLDGMNDARRVAHSLGIPHYITDMTELFGAEIIDYFKETYLAGETPNPCVKCNREIKWAAMLRKADALGCDYIATGHYVRLREENRRMILSRSRDLTKDQSYALWSVRNEHLRRTMFPLAELTKPEVRMIAHDAGLVVAAKKESYEICFVHDNDYRRFLRENIPQIDTITPEGDFVFHGEKVGRHHGVPFYTIGQRKGLGISLPSHPEPLYVTGLDVVNNIVELGDDDELFTTEMAVHSVNMVKFSALPDDGIRAVVKIRYKDEGSPAVVYPRGVDTAFIRFDEPRRAVTPGQSAVFYDGDDVIGGGIISRE